MSPGMVQLDHLSMSMLPVIGDYMDASEAITGKDVYTGETLSRGEVVIARGATLLPFVSGRLVREGLSSKERAEAIASHAVHHLSEFKEFGIKTRDDLARHIEKILNNPSVGKTDINTRDRFMLDRDTGTIVIENSGKSPGTAYIPNRGYTPQEAFDSLQSNASDKIMKE